MFNREHFIIKLRDYCFTAANQVEASTKLFPAVFVKPTTSNMFQFEVGRIKVEELLIINPVKNIRRTLCFITHVCLSA